MGNADTDSTGEFHAFKTTAGLPFSSGGVDLGTLAGAGNSTANSTANSVDDSGHVVGGAQLLNNNTDAFIWDPVNGMRDLNSLIPPSGWTLAEAQGISRSGLIIGFGYAPDLTQQLFLLTPILPLVPASQAAVTASGLVYSRVTQTYNGTVGIKNIGASALSGPFQIAFSLLTPGVTPTNAAGRYNGNYYVTVPAGALLPGQTVTVSVQFRNSANIRIGFTPLVYSGTLD